MIQEHQQYRRPVLIWLNCIRTKFSNYSSARIIKDQVIDYKVHCKHQFGEFVQVVATTINLIEVPHTIDALVAYPTGNKQETWRYFNITAGKPLSHKKRMNLTIPSDLPARIHALAVNESEDFVILDNHGNPFVGSNDNLLDAFSVDTGSVGVETVDDNDDTSSDSEDSSSDDKSENSGVSDRHLPKEGVNAMDRQENEKQQGNFNIRGMRGNLPNLPPHRASHRSRLHQPRHVNYTRTTVNHTNNNSKTQSTSVNHINKSSKRRSTSNSKYEHVDDVVINNLKNETTSSKQQTNKHLWS